MKPFNYSHLLHQRWPWFLGSRAANIWNSSIDTYSNKVRNLLHGITMNSHDNARAALTKLLRKSPRNKETQVWPMDTSKEYTSHLLNYTKDINRIQFESILLDLGILGIDSGQITMKNRKIVQDESTLSSILIEGAGIELKSRYYWWC